MSDVHRFRDVPSLAAAVAEDVTATLVAVQRRGGVPSLVLTGGTVARDVHRAMAALADRLDWSRVEVWWGDERHLPSGDPERNATQAWEDLLGRVPVDPARVHEPPPSDGGHHEVGSAASAYAHELRRAVEERDPGGPWFDVLMLGIGPDGHCASLFPGRAEVDATGDVVAVRDSPKPPPLRVSFTMPTLRRAQDVVFVATGDGKAGAVAASVAGGDLHAAPAAGPRGLRGTRWYVDDAAASAL